MIKIINNKNKLNFKNEKAITLIALVVTIVILIIFAGVSISLIIRENGIIEKAKQISKHQKIAEITEKLELYKADLSIEDLGKLVLERYLEKLLDENVIEQSDIQETGQENSRYITVENEYIFLIEKEESGNIKIEYLGTASQMMPRITKLEYIPSTTSIKIILEVLYNENGDYQYFIKESVSDTYGEGETSKNSEYTFEGLKPGTEYDVKIILTNDKNLSYEKDIKIATNKEGVTYFIDTDNVQNQTVSYGESVLNPSFTPTKEGYTFVGWREDNTAEDNVLSEKTMQSESISLYAVFKKEVTVTYDSNGGDTTPSTQVGYIYYNNGNIANPTFTLNAAISKTNYQFRAWALNSATSSTMFDASSTQIFSTDVTLYARWNVFTTKTGTYVGTINNWIGGSTVIQYGVTFVDKPTVTVSTSRSDLVPSASEINKSAFKLSWGSSSMSGGSGTLTWVAKGYVYDGDSPDVVKSGTIAWQINNWVAGPAVTVSFGTTFKSPPTVMASCERADISVSVSNITTTSCVISYGSSSNSGGSGTIYWTATGEV